MRHQKKGFKLNRTASHRKATMAALSNALIAHKRIKTTHTKAKALRMYVEPILTRGKIDTTHNRRQVFRHLQDKESVKELYGVIAGKIASRPGGYTRIVKLGQRVGDGAEMAIIELVDFNDSGDQQQTSTRRKRRTRRSSGASSSTTDATSTPKAAQAEAANESVPSPENHEDPAAPDQTSEVSAQSPGTPLTAPEETAGGKADNPEAGIGGAGETGNGAQKA